MLLMSSHPLHPTQRMYSTLASLKSCGQKKSCPKYSFPTMKYLPAVKYPLTMMHLVLCNSRPPPHLECHLQGWTI